MNMMTKVAAAGMKSPEGRVANYDWGAVGADLNAFGCAVLRNLLTPDECQGLASLYPREQHFRSHIHMARHGFGKGEYRYCKYPLPAIIGELRGALYAHIVPFANAWNERMNVATRYPTEHADYLEKCHAAGQAARRRFCCNTGPATSIACIRICTAIWLSRCRPRFCCPRRAAILPAANSC